MPFVLDERSRRIYTSWCTAYWSHIEERTMIVSLFLIGWCDRINLRDIPHIIHGILNQGESTGDLMVVRSLVSSRRRRINDGLVGQRRGRIDNRLRKGEQNWIWQVHTDYWSGKPFPRCYTMEKNILPSCGSDHYQIESRGNLHLLHSNSQICEFWYSCVFTSHHRAVVGAQHLAPSLPTGPGDSLTRSWAMRNSLLCLIVIIAHLCNFTLPSLLRHVTLTALPSQCPGSCPSDDATSTWSHVLRHFLSAQTLV